MAQAGLYSTVQIRPVREARCNARARLGQMLTNVERHQGKTTISHDAKKFMVYLREINLDKDSAVRAQRIGSLPGRERQLVFEEALGDDVLPTFNDLIERARPYWYKASRKRRHERIVALASVARVQDMLGPFPLIYADPPWRFHIYSEKGLERTPDQHYPTMSDEEIAASRCVVVRCRASPQRLPRCSCGARRRTSRGR
jgi:hypothetical protein